MASQKIKFVLIWAIRRDFRKEQDEKAHGQKSSDIANFSGEML